MARSRITVTVDDGDRQGDVVPATPDAKQQRLRLPVRRGCRDSGYTIRQTERILGRSVWGLLAARELDGFRTRRDGNPYVTRESVIRYIARNAESLLQGS